MMKAQTILITGASSGIGRALALHYAQDGRTLYLTGRNADRLNEAADLCRDKGAIVHGHVIDVTDKAGMKEWLDHIDDETPLDLVIANAGISGGPGGVMDGEPVDAARKIFAVNLDGVLNTVAPLLPRMLARGRGQIAFMSSMAGFRGFPSAPAYSASKGAVRFYGEALRGSLAGSGVAVNVICPGFIKSPMTDANNFKMPFLMTADRAAAIIARNLARNKGRIAFPWPIYAGVWLISIFPDKLAQIMLRRLPAKSSD